MEFNSVYTSAQLTWPHFFSFSESNTYIFKKILCYKKYADLLQFDTDL